MALKYNISQLQTLHRHFLNVLVCLFCNINNHAAQIYLGCIDIVTLLGNVQALGLRVPVSW
jgi:hypothetical protein